MWKLIAAVIAGLGVTSLANAQTAASPGDIAGQLKFWSTDTGQPVYYGEVRNVSRPGMQVLGHYQCLALAFIKYEGGIFTYAHKMWSKSPDGSCHYEDVTSHKVGNHGICVKDTNAGFGRAVGTALMTKDNIDVANSKFRVIDTNTHLVGETPACVPPKGVGAGLYSMKIENGRFKLMTTAPLDYEVSIEPQDPLHPPTKPVF